MSQETKASNWCEKHGQATKCTECNPIPKPKLRITLYFPGGGSETYIDCRIGASLMPELEFWGKTVRYSPPWDEKPDLLLVGKEEHITSTTLAYTIQEVLD